MGGNEAVSGVVEGLGCHPERAEVFGAGAAACRERREETAEVRCAEQRGRAMWELLGRGFLQQPGGKGRAEQYLLCPARRGGGCGGCDVINA